MPASASKRQEFFIWHSEVSQVPEDPEHYAEEDDERPREHKEIPEADGGKDAHKEEDQAHNITDHR